MYNGLWKSRVLPELVDQGDPGVIALVNEFKRLNAAHQLTIEGPPVQLAIDGPRVVLCEHSDVLCLEGTQAPMAIEWPQDDQVRPQGVIDCGGGQMDIDCGGGGHLGLDGGGDLDLDGAPKLSVPGSS